MLLYTNINFQEVNRRDTRTATPTTAVNTAVSTPSSAGRGVAIFRRLLDDFFLSVKSIHVAAVRVPTFRRLIDDFLFYLNSERKYQTA